MDWLPLVWVALGVVVLLVLNMKFKLNSFLSLLIVAFLVGILNGLSLTDVITTVKTGFGSTLGSLALIIGFGAVIGKLMVHSGAAQQIASTLIKKFGVKYVQIALIIIGGVFGISVFYEVAFIILAPLVISIAVEAKVPFMKLAVTAVAAATLAHSIFPPQAGPTALVQAYNADMGMVYMLGIVVFIPAVIAAGIIVPKLLRNIDYPVPPLMQQTKQFNENEMPKFASSLLVPLTPAIIISLGTILKLFISEGTSVYNIISFISSAEISMLIAVFVAIYVFGIRRGENMGQIMNTFSDGIKDIAMIIFIVGAGGAFKQVILDSGVGDTLAGYMQDWNINPLIMAWLITAIMRIITGQGVVSAITAAGIVAPLMDTMDVNPVLLVLATACGSNTITHVNDASFWLFKEYFNITIKDTFKTWGILLLTSSLVGLGVVLILDIFI
jgi:high-affinity gluconate transporter